MANVTIGFGLALAALGLGGYFSTGRSSLTALIPLGFGLLLLVCGFVARQEAARKHAMHAAAALGLLGVLGPLRVLPQMLRLLGGEDVPHRAAVLDQLAMMVLCAVFLVLCIRSFVMARRARARAA
ncbi:MAG TPA: hypothetical protein VMW75_06810 [Thermoanaerobaculia bacterium]|nr:hypothetical protein [Thermoanaerobaculia bacterium]